MPVYRLHVKWQKERFKDVECNTDENPMNFKAVLFSLTGVPPERQKIMMPGKVLEADFNGIKLKDGTTVMMVGTAEVLPQSEAVEAPVDDRTPTHDNLPKLPFGLVNLGNTCYMNSAIQLLFSVPELRAALNTSSPLTASGMGTPEALANNLRLLFRSMEKADQPVIPAAFVTCLRNACPQFAIRDSDDDIGKNATQSGGLMSLLAGARFAQQDANECWVELLRALQKVTIDPKTAPHLPALLRHSNSSAPWNPVDRYFTGQLLCTLTCTGTDEEAPSETVETFNQLSCFINQDVKFLHTGIRNGFEGSLTKHSTTLGRDAIYKKTSVLIRLPAYLSIHFVRFFYKEDKNLNAKILKDVKFPLELDLFTFCSESLQKDLIPVREKMRLYEDRMAHQFPAKGKAGSPVKESKEPDHVKNLELFDPYWLPADPGSNNSGYYELIGVLSHQGRTSSAGHYVSWNKVGDTWMKFDDDVVTPVTTEEILRLSGGGDWHCAYLLLYGPKRVVKVLPVESSSAGVPLEANPAARTGPNSLEGDRGNN